MTETLLALLLCAALTVAACGIGHLALGRVRREMPPLERMVFATACGIGILGLLVLAVGLCGLLSRPVLAGLLIAATLAGAALLVRERGKGTGTGLPLPPGMWGGFALLALFGLLSLIGALAPPAGNEWDSLAHQLAVPKIYLREGRIFYVPWVSHSNFPYLLQMHFTLMLGLGSIGAAKLCHWLCGVLLALSVWTFAVRHYADRERGRTIGMVAALFLASTPIVFWEASVAYVDLATALFTWLSLYALLNAAQAVALPEDREAPPATETAAPTAGAQRTKGAKRKGKPETAPAMPLTQPEPPGPAAAPVPGLSVAWLVVSAVLMGFALGTKLTVLGFWGISLLGILGWHLVRTRRWSPLTLPHAALWGAVSLLIASPWYIKSWLYTGNPVYPFFYGLFGGRYWNEANAAAYAADQAKFGLEKTLPNLLLSPWLATIGGREFTEYVAFGLSPVYLAFLFTVPYLARRLSRTALTLLLFGAGAYVFWFFMMQQTRYLLPALPALAIVAAEALAALYDELRIARAVGAALAAGTVCFGLYLAAAGITAPALPAVTGAVDWWEYISRTLPGLGPAIRYINEETPRNAKVALFDEVRGFYLDRDYLWATPNHSTILPWDRYTGVDDWLSDFRRRGYTTLLVYEGAAPKTDDGQRWRGLLRDAVVQGKIDRAFSQGGVTVWRIPE